MINYLFRNPFNGGLDGWTPLEATIHGGIWGAIRATILCIIFIKLRWI